MARLLIVTGVLLAAATAARPGTPCAAAAACPCAASACPDGDRLDLCDLDALPAEPAELEPPRDRIDLPAATVAAAVPAPRADVLALAPKTSPPALVA